MRKSFAVAMSLVLVLSGCSAQDPVVEDGQQTPDSGSTEVLFGSCEEMNQEFIGGVSRPSASNLGPIPIFPWVEDEALYLQHASLDSDSDGIACELLTVTPELELKWPLESALASIDWPIVGQNCGSLAGKSEDAFGYTAAREFTILRCDANSEWQPRFDANGEIQSVALDEATGFPLEVMQAVQDDLFPSYVATQAIDVPINPAYTEGETCGGGYGWQVLGLTEDGNPAFLKCPNGNGKFVVDATAYQIDPVSLKPLVPKSPAKNQLMAYSPHVYIIPEEVTEVPATQTDNPSNFQEMQPCKVRDRDSSIDKAFGFPLPAGSASLKPGFKILVLPVEFSDYPTDSVPSDDIGDVVIELSRYFERMASNEISFDWTIPESYATMPKSLASYNLSGSGDFFDYYVPYVQDAVNLFDKQYDFSEYDIVIVEEPRNVPDELHPIYVPAIRGNGNFEVRSNEGPVTRVLITGNDEIRDIPNWIHEFGHLLGLPDRNWFVGAAPGFDIMFGWYGSPEMSIWLRWLLGIASDSQISCVTTTTPSTHWIRPVAWDGDYLKGVVIPIDDSTVLVAESRRRLGYDALTGQSGEGVYVYRIDAKSKMYAKDTRILVDSVRPERSTFTQKDWSFDSQLKPGEEVTSDGWTIRVIETGAFGDVIQVEKTG